MKKEHWTSIGLFIFALMTLYESVKLGIWERRSPGVGTFPAMLGVLLAILSVQFFLRSTLKRREKQIVHDSELQWTDEPEPVLKASEVNWRKVFFSMGATAAYPFLFMKGGYVIGTAVFLFFMCKFVEGLKLPATLIITFVTIIVSYTIFGILLNVPLHH